MSTHAASAVRSAVADLGDISLAALVEQAGLQTRVDTKFIVYPAVLTALIRDLGDDVKVLDIEGRRQFRYSSTYFDTEGWRTYRDHLQGRRLRFKARTRHYVDSDLCMFEVKLEGARGCTEKLRTPHSPRAAHTLTPAARTHLRSVLADAGIREPGPLEPRLLTQYRRATLVHAGREARVTVDSDLVCSGGHGTRSVLTDRVLLEVKTATERDPILAALGRLGVRPVSVSKYCAGVALLHPEVPSHPWRAVLRRHFATAA